MQERKEGRKGGTGEGRKEENKERRKEGRKEGRKKGRKEGRKEQVGIRPVQPVRRRTHTIPRTSKVLHQVQLKPHTSNFTTRNNRKPETILGKKKHLAMVSSETSSHAACSISAASSK